MHPVRCPDAAELDRHRNVQQLAYRCAEEVSATLEAGTTEVEAAARMRAWLEERGIDEWLHLPFAWFGDRTAFRGFRHPFHFFPTRRRLERGMPFILDVAPVAGGIACDIGYSGSLGDNALVDRILEDLREHRALIVRLVKDRTPLSEIYVSVDRLATRQGLENRHKKYPSRVLAHRLTPLSEMRTKRTALGFGLGSVLSIGSSVVRAARQGWSPLWNDSRRSQHPPVPGLWAVEPHLAFGPVGAKFEELLVVTEDDAGWLDDHLPHVRRGRVAA